jgi:hypothetical protein
LADFSLTNSHFNRLDGINDTSFIFGSSWHNLGTVKINKEHNFDDMNSLYLETNHVNYVSITLDKFGAGLFMLTYDVTLNDSATEAVKKVVIDDPEFDIELFSYNIYSKKNRSFKCLSRSVSASEKLSAQINAVFRDVTLVWASLNKLIGISIEPSSCSSFAQICVLNEEPYFTSRSSEIDKTEMYEIKKTHPRNWVFSDERNSLLFRHQMDRFPFDGAYFYNKNPKHLEDGYPELWPPELSQSLIRDFSFIGIVSSEITALTRSIGRINYDKKGKVLSKKINDYFTLSYRAERLFGFLKSFRNASRPTNSKVFNEEVDRLLKYQFKRLDELKATISVLYKLSESKLQMDNLKYNKRYSLIVFFFVVVQVVLAVVAIDWSKSKTWFLNFKAFLGL